MNRCTKNKKGTGKASRGTFPGDARGGLSTRAAAPRASPRRPTRSSFHAPSTSPPSRRPHRRTTTRRSPRSARFRRASRQWTRARVLARAETNLSTAPGGETPLRPRDGSQLGGGLRGTGDRGGGVHLATLGAAGNAAYAIIGMPRAHARKGSAVRPDWRSCEVWA